MLGQAISSERGYALKAAADGDFQRYDAAVTGYLKEFRQAKLTETLRCARAVMDSMERLSEKCLDKGADPWFQRLQRFCDTAHKQSLLDILRAMHDLDSYRVSIPIKDGVHATFEFRLVPPGHVVLVEGESGTRATVGQSFFMATAPVKNELSHMSEVPAFERDHANECCGVSCCNNILKHEPRMIKNHRAPLYAEFPACQKFVEWLNRLVGRTRYRFPTRAELGLAGKRGFTDPDTPTAPENPDPHFWCEDGKAYYLDGSRADTRSRRFYGRSGLILVRVGFGPPYTDGI